MRSLLGGLGDASRSVLRVRSERLDRPTNFVRRRLSGISSWFSTPRLPTTGADRYGTDPTFFAIVSGLAQDTADVQFRLWQPGATGEDDDRTEVKRKQHPCVDLVNKPNGFQSGAELREVAQQHIDSLGECILYVERIAGVPVRMWVLQPWKLTPVEAPVLRTPVNQKFLRGWIYLTDDGTQIPLGNDEIIQIKLPNPADPYRGIGPVQAALHHLDAARYSAEWNRNFFLNNASPDGVIQIEARLSDDEFDEFQTRWRETHQGLNNAHRVAILENEAVWVPNQFTQRDMQFQELQMLASDFIRKAFRFPKTMLGDTDNANRAVAEAGEYTYGKWMVEPRARRWAAALNNRLLPMFGENSRELYWDFDPVVESDEQVEAVTISTRATAAQTLIQTGFDSEEVLAAVGLPPMTWKKPEVPGFDEDGKPFPKPGESSGSSSSGDREKRPDDSKSPSRS